VTCQLYLWEMIDMAIFFITAWIALSLLLVFCGSSLLSSAAKEREKQDMIKRLQRLDAREREVLRYYWKVKSKTLTFNLSNPIIAGLVYEKILVVISELRVYGNPFALYYPMRVNPVVWEHIDKHRELVGEYLPVKDFLGDYTVEELDDYLDTRLTPEQWVSQNEATRA